MKLGELLKKRETLEKQSVERQLADVNAQIARAEADEDAQQAAARDEAHRAALADARAKRDDAQARALGALALCAGALDDMEAAELALQDLGVVAPAAESHIYRDTRKAVRNALRVEADLQERAARAAIPPEETRRAFLRGAYEHAQYCADVAKKSGRDDLIRNTQTSLREAREALGIAAPLGEHLFGPISPNRAAIEDATAQANHDYYAAKAADLRARGL